MKEDRLTKNLEKQLDTKIYIENLIKQCEQECEVIAKRDLIKGFKSGYEKGVRDALQSIIDIIENSNNKKMTNEEYQVYKNIETIIVSKVKRL